MLGLDTLPITAILAMEGVVMADLVALVYYGLFAKLVYLAISNIHLS